jgi:hypothetical protein
LAVDHAGNLYQPGLKPVYPGLPREIIWIDRNAMAAQAWSRVKRHKAKRLCFSSLDDFPDVNVKLATHPGHFVSQRNIYAAKSVLQKLGQLGGPTRGHHHHLVHQLFVEQHTDPGGLGAEATYHLGRVAQTILRVTGVDPLRRVGQEEIPSGDQSGGFKQRLDLLLCGPRVGGGLQHHQLARGKVRGDRLRGGPDMDQVGHAVAYRRGDTDQHDIALRQRLEGGGELDSTTGHPGCEDRLLHPGNDQVAPGQRIHPGSIGVDAGDREPGIGGSAGQGKSHVALPDDRHPGSSGQDPSPENGGIADGSSSPKGGSGWWS